MVKWLVICLVSVACNRTVATVTATASKKASTFIDGSGSTGNQLSYQWRFVQGGGDIQKATSKISKVTFTSKGIRLIELLVRDSEGQISRDTMKITVN